MSAAESMNMNSYQKYDGQGAHQIQPITKENQTKIAHSYLQSVIAEANV